MLHRNGKEIEQIFRNGREIALLYKNGVIIYDKRGHAGPTMKTFQDLIDEGYVTISKTWPNGNNYSQGWVGRAIGLTVSPNCPYSIEQISDFNEVFNSTKMVSFEGVVGEGEIPNAFLWPSNHWLTDNEIYTLYNNVTLSHDVIAEQFKYLNWANKSTLTIKYNSASGNWYFTDGGIFGPNMPETINFDVGNRRFSSTCDIFGRHNKIGDSTIVPMSNTVTLNWITITNNGVNDIVRTAAGMFEGASKLTTINGVSFNNAQDLSNTFNGCSSLVTIPASLATNGISNSTNFTQTFNNCTNLESIVPVLNVQNVTSNGNTFNNDAHLTTMSLYHINALKNQDWHLETTILNQTSANYIVTNVYEGVDTSVSGFVYKNIYFPATVTITQAQASRLYDYGWNCYVNGQLISPTQYTITYVNGETSEDITGNLPAQATVYGSKYTIPSSDLAWSEHGLLGYSETQYPSYANIETAVYAPESKITVDHNMTLYPVWNVTFQGLIDEGYVTITTDKTYNDAACQPLRVASNHYPKELVTDFNDVFFSTNNKMVSVNGVVGEGTYPNVFVFDSASHWLSDDELYTLYNNNTLPHWPQAGQFKYVDWHNYNSIHFIFRGTGTPFNNAGGTQDTFFRNGQAPQNITIDLGCSTVKNLNVAFRSNSANKVTPRTITFIGENNDPILVTGTMQGSFEACGSLTTISGLNIDGASYIGPSSQYYNNTFQGCASLTTLPQSLAPTGTSNGTTNRPVAMSNMFKGCTSLQEIKFIINCANVGSNTDTFLNCTSLTEVYLNGINAKKNQNWDLSSTDISSESITYIVDNLTEWSDFDSSNDTYKDLLLPSNRVLTDAQIAKLNRNGWKVYSGGQELYSTE